MPSTQFQPRGNTIETGVNSNLSGGAIAGIVIGVIIFLVLVVVGIIYFNRWNARKRHEHAITIQKDRNTKGEVRKRDGTLIGGHHGRPKFQGMGHSYYHESGHETV